jgi:hypothetical protein
MSMVDGEAEPLGVELLGAVDVRHRDDDDFQGPVHGCPSLYGWLLCTGGLPVDQVRQDGVEALVRLGDAARHRVAEDGGPALRRRVPDAAVHRGGAAGLG